MIATTNLQRAFAWHPHFDVWLLIVSLLAVYFLALRRHKERFNVSATNRQIASYVSGVVILWVASDYPIHDLAEHYLFSVHMLQHLLITLAAPPLMISGMPDWMLRAMFCRPKIKMFAKFFFTPLIAGVIFNIATVVTHLPVVVDAVLYHHWLHFFVHAAMFAAAWAMWMPVFNQLPELPSMSTPLKLLYLFLQSIIPTVPAAFITFADKPLFPFYEHAPRLWRTFTAVEDQQTAGAIMKVIGGGFLWTFIVVLFFRWKDEEDSNEHTLTMSEAERVFQDSPAVPENVTH